MAGETKKNIRLSKAAKEFNIGIGAIIEFLSKKGFEVDSSPNTKLTEEMYALLVKEYGAEEPPKPARCSTSPPTTTRVSSSALAILTSPMPVAHRRTGKPRSIGSARGNRKSLRRDIVFHGYIISWFSWFFIFLQLKKSQLQINTYHRCYDQEGYIL